MESADDSLGSADEIKEFKRSERVGNSRNRTVHPCAVESAPKEGGDGERWG